MILNQITPAKIILFLEIFALFANFLKNKKTVPHISMTQL